jgi:undecaprenyl-phosphate 4-deoxy-4-formamido-L-arabinose transferase
MKISVVIPVFNGEKTLELLYKRITDFFEGKSYEYEIVFVWDCGDDNSWEVIKLLKSRDPGIIRAIRLSRNYGQHNAIIAGFRIASGELVVTIDEDLQHDPNDIEILLKEQQKTGSDVIYGSYDVLHHNAFRKLTSVMLKKIIRIGIPEVHPMYSPFRLIKLSVARETLNMSNSYTFLDGYLAWITQDFSFCRICHHDRIAGESSYTLRKLINHAVNIFVTFSDLPLKVVKYASFGFLAFTIIFSLMTLYKKFFLVKMVPGFASTIILLSTGFGMVLMALGVLGDYLHLINQKTTKRPNYVIREVI